MEIKDRKPYINVDYFEDLTGDVTRTGVDHTEEMGERIRVLREEKGLTLDEFSHLTGFEIDFLLKIEKNEIQPQLGTLIKLSKALDEAFSRIVSCVGDRLYSITRKDDAKPIARSTSQRGKKHLYTYKGLASEVWGRHMEAMTVVLEEGMDETESVHQGEEFIYVLEGCVYLKIGGDECELNPGDSVYYLSTIPHHICAKEGKAVILAVLYEG
jgi:transcriptional regulator with XRE-family HTH domain